MTAAARCILFVGVEAQLRVIDRCRQTEHQSATAEPVKNNTNVFVLLRYCQSKRALTVIYAVIYVVAVTMDGLGQLETGLHAAILAQWSMEVLQRQPLTRCVHMRKNLRTDSHLGLANPGSTDGNSICLIRSPLSILC